MESVDLKTAILQAFSRSPSVTQQAYQMGIGQAQIREAQSAWYPQVGLNANTGSSTQQDFSNSLNNAAAYGMTLSQLIYDFGKTNASVNQQKSSEESYRYKLLATMSDVAEQTATAYLDVLKYQELTQAVEENIRALEDVRRMSSLRSDAGLTTRSDVLQAQSRISGMRSTLKQYQASLSAAKAQLTALTGVDAKSYKPFAANTFSAPVMPNNIDYSKIPTVLYAQAQKESASYEVSKAKSDYLPTLSLQANRTRYETQNNPYWNNQIQLHVSAPLYQGGAVSARVSQAEGRKNIAGTVVDQAKLDILQKASVAYANWAGAEGQAQASAEQLQDSVRSRDVYKNEYKLNQRTLNDLLSVEQDVFQAKFSQISAKYDSGYSLVNYATAVNDLLPQLGINQGAKQSLPDLK
ncbi:TolC family outer membrane protein [Rahnella laticis]|uniref:TolC family outer membrane protein n=1 Tax=Rahnella laticis TaxID=2787622 RepID=UPI001E400A06|nr:TolC family outer membrane protein [Rahnella laticis]